MSIILLNNKEITFEKRYSSRAKNIRISINSKWELILTIPNPGFFSSKTNIENKAIKFLVSKSDWIFKNINTISKNNNHNPDLNNSSRTHYIKHKQQARDLCENKCKLWSSVMNLEYNKVSIKSMKTKWWSCSSKKNLNFNYKILFIKEEEQNYLIVHELAHLKHMNHSKDFWDLVCATLWDEKFRRYKINN